MFRPEQKTEIPAAAKLTIAKSSTMQAAAKRPSVALHALETSGVGGPCSTPKSSARYAVYDLVEDGPPRTFIEAAERGDDSYIIKTIERTLDFNINQTDRTGRSALHWAAEANHVTTARTLLDFGCDLKLQECMGRTAVHMAARAADADMMGALLDDLADLERTDLINAADKSGITPVFLAFQRGEEGRSAFEYLMAHGARYNQQQLEEQAKLL